MDLVKDTHYYKYWSNKVYRDMYNTSNICLKDIQSVNACEAKHGKGAERCLRAIMREKVCLASNLCPYELDAMITQCGGIENDGTKAAFRTPECKSAIVGVAGCMGPYMVVRDNVLDMFVVGFVVNFSLE